jgi:hypothetical protein
VSLPPRVADILLELALVFREQRVAWYLFGAQATNIWGVPRLTADIDITVEMEDRPRERFLSAMRAGGFELRVRDVDRFTERTRVLPFVHRASKIPVDIVLAGPGLEEEFFRRSRMLDIGPVTIPVISPEDLVVTKLLAGRNKDMDDVRGILRTQRQSLDVQVIRKTLELLDKVLDRGDLAPLLESELAAIGK